MAARARRSASAALPRRPRSAVAAPLGSRDGGRAPAPAARLEGRRAARRRRGTRDARTGDQGPARSAARSGERTARDACGARRDRRLAVDQLPQRTDLRRGRRRLRDRRPRGDGSRAARPPRDADRRRRRATRARASQAARRLRAHARRRAVDGVRTRRGGTRRRAAVPRGPAHGGRDARAGRGAAARVVRSGGERDGRRAEWRVVSERTQIPGNSPFEPIVGYARAVRVGAFVWVSGTTATGPDGKIVGGSDVFAQAQQCLANLATALQRAGASIGDVVRTRIFVTDVTRWAEVARAHAAVFGDVRPACTMVEVKALVSPEMLVEIEADAVIASQLA
ncbi:MAG: RidA family protein [Planctomycetes bacterium]|nr:RidA family protein [Planctomycetota bacterium]